jgi:hypothetical protein
MSGSSPHRWRGAPGGDRTAGSLRVGSPGTPRGNAGAPPGEEGHAERMAERPARGPDGAEATGGRATAMRISRRPTGVLAQSGPEQPAEVAW